MLKLGLPLQLYCGLFVHMHYCTAVKLHMGRPTNSKDVIISIKTELCLQRRINASLSPGELCY